MDAHKQDTFFQNQGTSLQNQGTFLFSKKCRGDLHPPPPASCTPEGDTRIHTDIR